MQCPYKLYLGGMGKGWIDIEIIFLPKMVIKLYITILPLGNRLVSSFFR